MGTQVMEGNRLTVGYIAGAHGIRGGIHIQLHDRDSEALHEGMEVWLVPPARAEGSPRTFEIERLEFVPGKAGRVRVSFKGIDDRNAAEALKGYAVEAEREALPPLEEDEFYLADAVGLSVEREHEGQMQQLGVVKGLSSNGAQDLFEIEWRDERGKAHEWLLPVIPQFIRELDERHVLVELPLGLLPEPLEPPEHD